MRYLSVCSGIEAATVAWEPLGWKPVAFAEIARFPSAVLKYRYPGVLNLGDFTHVRSRWFKEWLRRTTGSDELDVLMGGTPCQDFSVAGLRSGVAGDRGDLTLEFLRLARRLRPRWVVWENVPGVLSSRSHDAPDPVSPDIDLDGPDGPRDGEEVVVEDQYETDEVHAFSAFLAGLSDIGYGWAYRVFDAQYFALAQRRRRVFVVARLGDEAGPAAVFFERDCLWGNPPEGLRAGQDVAGGTPDRPLDCFGAPVRNGVTCGETESAATLTAYHSGSRFDAANETFVVQDVSHSLTSSGHDASEDGTGRYRPRFRDMPTGPDEP